MTTQQTAQIKKGDLEAILNLNGFEVIPDQLPANVKVLLVNKKINYLNPKEKQWP